MPADCLTEFDVSSVRWVRQEDELGCAAACLAMVAGRTYAEAKAALVSQYFSVPVPNWAVDWVLGEWGFAVLRRYQFRQQELGGIWPQWPISDVHICTVRMPFPHSKAKAHMVVLLYDGTVLDPTTPEPQTLGTYPEIYTVAGIVPIGG